jgi:hypothetical protein
MLFPPPPKPSPSEGEDVKKSVCVFFPSFQRKPESSIFKPLREAWTPVFTGVTTKGQFFHTFRGGMGEGDAFDILSCNF